MLYAGGVSPHSIAHLRHRYLSHLYVARSIFPPSSLRSPSFLASCADVEHGCPSPRCFGARSCRISAAPRSHSAAPRSHLCRTLTSRRHRPLKHNVLIYMKMLKIKYRKCVLDFQHSAVFQRVALQRYLLFVEETYGLVCRRVDESYLVTFDYALQNGTV